LVAARHPARRSIRLPGYDYRTPGAYFVTICAYRRELLFADPAVDAMIRESWDSLPEHLPNVRLDAFIVMPNHVHGII
jgi:REP element-mobilizing transposase RayT